MSDDSCKQLAYTLKIQSVVYDQRSYQFSGRVRWPSWFGVGSAGLATPLTGGFIMRNCLIWCVVLLAMAGTAFRGNRGRKPGSGGQQVLRACELPLGSDRMQSLAISSTQSPAPTGRERGTGALIDAESDASG